MIFGSRFINHIIDSMADGVFTLDNSGKITSWNHSMTRITGYSSEEAIGNSCNLLQCSRCFGVNCPSNIQQCGVLDSGLKEAKECHLQHKDGLDVPVIKHAGAVKGDDGEILGVVETVTDLTELNQTRRKAEEAIHKLAEIHRLDNIFGKSKKMKDVFAVVKATANSDATTIIQGESGTGKELIAGAIHYHSRRKNHPLITINCGALPENLLESELFGHIKGAYTGATHTRQGRFEEADGGTVFLDEIGELSLYTQVKLLRVLQEHEIERLGESVKRKVDIRVVAATNRDLLGMVQSSEFREDLYYRLNVFPITLPPLRERPEDIPLLVNHFITSMNRRTGKKIMDASRQVMKTFLHYNWPGNVRELENAIEHAFVLCGRDRIEIQDLPRNLQEQTQNSTRRQSGNSAHKSRPKVQKEQLIQLLKECDWSKAEVARRLDVSHTAIWKYMKKWEIPLKFDDLKQV